MRSWRGQPGAVQRHRDGDPAAVDPHVVDEAQVDDREAELGVDDVSDHVADGFLALRECRPVAGALVSHVGPPRGVTVSLDRRTPYDAGHMARE